MEQPRPLSSAQFTLKVTPKRCLTRGMWLLEDTTLTEHSCVCLQSGRWLSQHSSSNGAIIASWPAVATFGVVTRVLWGTYKCAHWASRQSMLH